MEKIDEESRNNIFGGLFKENEEIGTKMAHYNYTTLAHH